MGIDMPRSVALRIAMIQRAIAKEDLYDEDGFGLEKHPHVTLAYGHEEDDPRSTKEAIKEILQGQGTVGGLSHFDQGDYKVLKFDVDSPDLHALNKAVRAGVRMPGETHKTYRPHVTVAYLKKDVDPAKYARLANFVSGQKFPISAIRWSNPADRYSTLLIPRLAKTAAEVEHGVAKGQDMELQPTEAQIKAENYKKAHVTIDGLDISIENPFKSVRSGVDDDGNEWSQTMWDDYGYIRGSRGYDKDHLDVFINPGIPHDETIWDAESVYVINQLDADGKFDEHKCMIGYVTKQQAVQAYRQNYEDGWDRDGAVVELPWAEFKEWAMSDGPTKGELKPLAKQAEIKTYHMDIRAIDREIRLKQRLADPRLRKIAKIVLDIEMGDTVLVGRFKNKPVKVESIGTDENGQPTINGRKLLALRIKKLLPAGGPVAATTSAKAKQLKKQADAHFRLMANPSLRDRLVVVGNLLPKTAAAKTPAFKFESDATRAFGVLKRMYEKAGEMPYMDAMRYLEGPRAQRLHQKLIDRVHPGHTYTSGRGPYDVSMAIKDRLRKDPSLRGNVDSDKLSRAAGEYMDTALKFQEATGKGRNVNSRTVMGYGDDWNADPTHNRSWFEPLPAPEPFAKSTARITDPPPAKPTARITDPPATGKMSTGKKAAIATAATAATAGGTALLMRDNGEPETGVEPQVTQTPRPQPQPQQPKAKAPGGYGTAALAGLGLGGAAGAWLADDKLIGALAGGATGALAAPALLALSRRLRKTAAMDADQLEAKLRELCGMFRVPADAVRPKLNEHNVGIPQEELRAAAQRYDLHKKALKYDPAKEWIGVDLDGTLARYTEWKGRGHIGAPIKPMVDRVKAWLADGKKVKILTARASGDDGKARYHIDKWCMAHIGQVLPITCVKDMYCTAIYDDKAKGVTKNTGKIKTMVKRAVGK